MPYIDQSDLDGWAPAVDPIEIRLAHTVMDDIRERSRDLDVVQDGGKVQIELQGSMKTGTALRGESDFDIAVTLIEPPLILGEDNEPDRESASRLSNFNHDVGTGTADLGQHQEAGFFSHRQFHRDRLVDIVARSRVEGESDAVVLEAGNGYGGFVWNWPDQYERAIQTKDDATNGAFKETVRVAKGVRLQVSRIAEPPPIPSYFLEGLLFHLPEDEFDAPLADRLRSVLSGAEALVEADQAADMLDPTGCQQLFKTPIVDCDDAAACLREMAWLLDHDQPQQDSW